MPGNSSHSILFKEDLDDVISKFEIAKCRHPEILDIPHDCLLKKHNAIAQRKLRHRSLASMHVSIFMGVGFSLLLTSVIITLQICAYLSNALNAIDYKKLGVNTILLPLSVGSFTVIGGLFLIGNLIAGLGRNPKLGSKPTEYPIILSSFLDKDKTIIAIWGWVFAGLCVFLMKSSYNLGSGIIFAWLLPTLMISMLPLYGAAIFFARNLYRIRISNCDIEDIEFEFIGVLSRWPDVDDKGSPPSWFNENTERLRSLLRSYAMRNFPKTKQHPNKAIDTLDSNIEFLNELAFFSHENRTTLVRETMVHYFNSIGKRELGCLGAKLTGAESIARLPPRRKFLITLMRALGILVFCVGPLVAWVIFKNSITKYSIPDGTLLFCYSLWLGAGLYCYLEHSNKSGPSTLVEVIKLLRGK